MKKKFSLLFIVSCLLMYSCRKDSFTNAKEATLNISSDTLHFDTLFTTAGSTTRFFKLYNANNRKLLISSIEIAGGSASYFDINADGVPGPVVNNLEMEANDSLYVFVTVKIDPSLAQLPFLVEDSIHISFNGNSNWVQLQAWGQNAHFLDSRLITGNTTWTNDKPYVITGGLIIAENASLTIQPGTHIYLHADAPFLVDGTLKAAGEKYDSTRIVFQGDRLDHPYNGFPGSWPGIYFRESSSDNQLQYVKILNAYQGIVVEKPSLNNEPKLRLQECIIDNCYDAGILGVQSSIEAENCLISNSGKNILLLFGGKYDFVHCTSVAYSNAYVSHRQPVLAVTDFVENGTAILSADLSASFRNCIFWGDDGVVDNEVVVDKRGSGLFTVDFRNCLWKLKDQPANVSVEDMIENEDPLFANTDNSEAGYDFRPGILSPVIDKGIDTGLPTDLTGNPRKINLPDLGAYELQ